LLFSIVALYIPNKKPMWFTWVLIRYMGCSLISRSSCSERENRTPDLRVMNPAL
jgi:hypothetical protein